MRHLLFLTAIAGIFFTVDTLQFRGRYRSEIWQQATYAGYAFNREVESKLRRVFR
jgi:hypothetical protein